MKNADSHLSDQQLLLDVEGELSRQDEKRVRAHLHACWKCRVRRQELESAIANFVRLHQLELDATIPSGAGPRALLKARIAQLSAAEPAGRWEWLSRSRKFAWGTATCGLLALALFLALSSAVRQDRLRRQAWIISIPDPRLTPGATLLVSRSAVCAQANTKNKAVPAAVQRQVFQEYGIAGVDPRAYEVDYLVTPALGGADDIHNLWPQSYSATAWNSQVKDALEDRLRGMVCDGSLDLTEAQRDIASDWIAAYKKYFHTERPLAGC
jgi:anti-sigma factor RsiW